MSEVLAVGAVARSLVRPDGVVGVLPGPELLIQVPTAIEHVRGRMKYQQAEGMSVRARGWYRFEYTSKAAARNGRLSCGVEGWYPA